MIENETIGKIFRMRCQDQNEFAKKGDLCVGMGTKEIDEGNEIEVYKTAILSLPENSSENYPCILMTDNTEGNETGLAWVQIFDVVKAPPDPTKMPENLNPTTIYFVKE